MNHFAHLDPDPADQICADPDPQNWKTVNKNYYPTIFCRLGFLISVNWLRAPSHTIFPIVSETISYIWEISQHPSAICSLPSTIPSHFRSGHFLLICSLLSLSKRGRFKLRSNLPSFRKPLIILLDKAVIGQCSIFGTETVTLLALPRSGSKFFLVNYFIWLLFK